MQEQTAILEFKGVTVRPVSSQISGISKMDFSLERGEIALVGLEEGREHIPLASLAQGLLVPDSGCVLFQGVDWAEMKASRQSIERGRIRRVYEHYGWVTNLDVMENLCLAECHHTRRARGEVMQEVRGLARRFGLNDVPEARPTRVHGMVLRKLEWVRALVGTPSLIILERPLFGAPKADAPKLMEAVCEASRQGVAVLWLTEDERLTECRSLGAVRRFRMDGEKLVAVSNGRESDG
jgi:phospholipid/cholesterol/gamma-HCH transport system ATP-binding protein